MNLYISTYFENRIDSIQDILTIFALISSCFEKNHHLLRW